MIAGRGRPFVGGKADAFNFAPFAGNEAYASLPSAHAITAFALAFAIGAVWPRARVAMIVYALLAWGIVSLGRLIFAPTNPASQSVTSTRRNRL